MRGILKRFIIATVTLYLVSQSVQGITFVNGIESLVVTGAVLTGVSLIVKPILNILLLPINLVTFGLFKWVTFVVTLYLVTLLYTPFKVGDFAFAGYNSYWFSIPSINLSGVLAFVAFSFLISFVSSILHWVLH